MHSSNEQSGGKPIIMNLLSSFGSDARSPEMEAIYGQLGVMKRPQLPDDDPYVFYDWVLARRQGIELGFVDEQHHRNQDRTRWGRGRLLFVQAYYYAGFDGMARCTWPLPHGITWEDSREQVRERMAEAASTLHSSQNSDVWDLPGYRITVTYAGEPPYAERIFCRQEPIALQAPTEAQAPDLGQIVAHWGSSVEQPGWRALWQTWLDDDAIEQGVEDGEIDLTESFGVTLHVTTEGGGPLLRAITLHRNRDTNSVGWCGALPQGLSFDDSPDTLFKKILSKPVRVSQGATTGHAVWQFPNYTLHILFSCVDNRLLRIKLLAPGVWQSIHD